MANELVQQPGVPQYLEEVVFGLPNGIVMGRVKKNGDVVLEASDEILLMVFERSGDPMAAGIAALFMTIRQLNGLVAKEKKDTLLLPSPIDLIRAGKKLN